MIYLYRIVAQLYNISAPGGEKLFVVYHSRLFVNTFLTKYGTQRLTQSWLSLLCYRPQEGCEGPGRIVPAVRDDQPPLLSAARGRNVGNGV